MATHVITPEDMAEIRGWYADALAESEGVCEILRTEVVRDATFSLIDDWIVKAQDVPYWLTSVNLAGGLPTRELVAGERSTSTWYWVTVPWGTDIQVGDRVLLDTNHDLTVRVCPTDETLASAIQVACVEFKEHA